jgi:predicted MFS family arabinose efflux permease
LNTDRAGVDAHKALSPALVAVALVVAVIGSLGAPLIVPVAQGMGVSLAAAQWTLTIALFSGAIAGPVLGRLGAGPHRRTTILAVLVLVCLGGVLVTLPLPFWILLVGRALQGTGIGVVALLMSVARDRLPKERSASTIATISVASTVGTGVGYPLIGLIDQVAGLRAAYGMGLVLSLCALVIAWRMVPAEEPGDSARVDYLGAGLLGLGTLGLLYVIAQPGIWATAWTGVLILVAALAVLGMWVAAELRVSAPMVNLRLLAQPAVLRANGAMLIVGVGMYLLFSSLTRYVQTPQDASYGFGLPGVLAGASLIPFSVLGFVAGKVAPAALKKLSERWDYGAAAVSVIVAGLLFALVPDSLTVVLLSMTVLGFGVGGVSAVMPRLVLTGVPTSETASVLSINQIMRSIGFSIGSALAGLILATSTAPGDLIPAQSGYTTTAYWVIPFVAVSIVVATFGRRKRVAAEST